MIPGILPQSATFHRNKNNNMCQGLNSHYFHIIGDKLINPIVGLLYTHCKDSVIKAGIFPIPNNMATFHHGTYELNPPPQLDSRLNFILFAADIFHKKTPTVLKKVYN